MRLLVSVLSFYKSFILFSFGINIVLLILGFSLTPIIIAKLLIVINLSYIINASKARKKLVFYKNLGISSFKLFGIVFIIDLLLTTLFVLIIKSFI